MIPRPTPGTPISQTSGSSKWLGRIVDGVNQRGKQIKQRVKSAMFPALSINSHATNVTGGETERGLAFSGRFGFGAGEQLLQEDRIFEPRGNNTQWGPDDLDSRYQGLWAVAAQDIGRQHEPGRFYTQGTFPARVKILHHLHRFVDVKTESGVPFWNAKLESSAYGSARIIDIERRQHDYISENDRLTEGTYTVTQDDIDNEVVFGEYREDVTSAVYNPSKYFTATGSPGSVTWVEADDVWCLIEKPTVSPLPIQFGEDYEIEAAGSDEARAVDVEFDFGEEEILRTNPTTKNIEPVRPGEAMFCVVEVFITQINVDEENESSLVQINAPWLSHADNPVNLRGFPANSSLTLRSFGFYLPYQDRVQVHHFTASGLPTGGSVRIQSARMYAIPCSPFNFQV